MSDAKLFFDGIKAASGLQLFTLLDPYPSLKQSFLSLKADDFNTRLDSSLRLSSKEDVLGVLRMVQRLFLKSKSDLQKLFSQLSKLLNRIQKNNPTNYANIQPLLERIRNYDRPVIRNIIPITTSYLLTEYQTKNTATIAKQISEFGATLGNANSIELLEKYQDLSVKGLRSNTNFRSALEEVLNVFFDPVLSADKKLKNDFINLVYGFGEMFWKRGGALNDTSSETVIKTLMVNLERFFTVGGSRYDAIYSYSDMTLPVINPAEMNSITIDLFILLRQFILPPAVPLTKDPNAALLDKLSINMAQLPFTAEVTGAENSLLDMMNQDSSGKDRRTVTTSSVLSTLESLFLTLSIVDIFGYNWDLTTTRSWVTGSTGGQINLADTLWSLQAKTHSGDAINFNSILSLSKTSGSVFKSNIAGNLITLTGAVGIDFNTPVLSLLERESIGAALPIETAGTDLVYRKTVPWVLNWIRRVTYSGYGPYYNANKKDGSGNFLAPDGTIARFANLTENNYKPTWQTARYKVCTTRSGPAKDIGLGGTEYANCNIANPGTNYTIGEISKSNAERAVASDEEAFYKNFQWLLYEKRFVVIIPASAKLDAALTFQEALFIVAIGNGLKGMMGIKPYCSGSGAATCGGTSNGSWRNNPSITLRNPSVTYLDLNPANFSSLPGDSALYVQGWGFGAAGNLAFQEAFVLVNNAVWSLLIPNPSQVYGLIPPVISLNFPVLERLGFTNDQTVTPDLTSSNWSKRNRLLPLVVALAKTLDDEVDVATNKNPFTILTDLSKLLSRPFLFKENDRVITTPAYSIPPSILSFRMTDDNPIRTATATLPEYQPAEIFNSPIGFLIESRKRFQDGALTLFAKTDSINYLLRTISTLGQTSRSVPRTKLIAALKKLALEIKINIDGVTLPHQFNFQLWVSEQVSQLANYPDNRSANVRHVSWAGVDDSIGFVRDYVSKTSGYSLVKSLDFILDLLIDIKPTAIEIKSLLDLVDSLLFKEVNGRYNLTNIMTENIPALLNQMAPNGRNFFGVFYSLASSNGFVNYTEKNMSFAPYLITNLISDFENLLNSKMIMIPENNPDSLLYAAGVLIGAFADIYEYGKKMDSVGFPFADGLNANENTSVWQRLNIILSSK